MERKSIRIAPPELGRSLQEVQEGLVVMQKACRLKPVISPTAVWMTVISTAVNSFR